jgi:hypothetical protein
LVFFQNLDFDAQDVAVFGAKLLQFATASEARRLAEYERLSWWQFLAAEHASEKFQNQLRGIPRMMVAMDSMRGSARTIGVITLQLLRDFAFSGMQNDRTLGGPTTQIWIDPWLAHLRGKGVELRRTAAPADSEPSSVRHSHPVAEHGCAVGGHRHHELRGPRVRLGPAVG